MTSTARPGIILGLDLGGTALAGGLVDTAGAVQASHVVPTDRPGRGDGVLQNLVELIGRLAEEARHHGSPILGIGMGVPGVIEAETGTIGEDIQNLPELRGFGLGRFLRERTGMPCVVDNDVNVLLLGEWIFGQARGLRHVAMIAVGTGVGGGLILNGSLVRGAHGYGGEIGHTTVDLEGRNCFCGSRGCIKAYVSGPDLADQARMMLRGDRTSILSELAGGDINRIDSPMVFEAAAKGDPTSLTIVAKAAQALGAGVANLINLCNPELVILSGGVMAAGEILLEPVRRWARTYAFEAAFLRTKIVRSSLTKRSGVQGAAALFLYESGAMRG
jgi:glucokinase